jgi:hypothetical protein
MTLALVPASLLIPLHAISIFDFGQDNENSSPGAIQEFVRVVGYRKFLFSPEEIAPLVDATSLSTIVDPCYAVDVVTRDPTSFLRLHY